MSQLPNFCDFPVHEILMENSLDFSMDFSLDYFFYWIGPQATQQRHLAFQLFYEHTNDFTNKCEPDLFIWALTTSFVISHNSALSLCHHLSRALSILELMNENELQPIGKPIHFIFPNRRWEALNTRGEPIPEELQFTIPHFGGIGPLTSTGYWVNSLKRIDSFPGIAVHNF